MNISGGIIPSAQKVVLYGTEGIGKSTLASQFPDPLFIDTEGSTKRLNVRRYDKPTSWEMLLAQVEYTRTARPCKTLVIDTVDWAEQLCIDAVCGRHDKKGIEDFGYGNGYVYEKEEFGRLLNRLEGVIEAGIHVVLTAHAILRKFEQPDELGAYDRWELKLGKKTTNLIAPMVKEWADAVFFCNYKTFSVAVDKDGKRHKAQGGKRVIYTAHHPCWDAKNRVGLPEEIPMEYDAIRCAVEFEVSGNQQSETEQKLEQIVDSSVQPSDGLDPRIPAALRDLMTINHVTEADLRDAVSKKGYFPAGMPVADYPADFINGVLIGAWPQVYEMIKGDLPF